MSEVWSQKKTKNNLSTPLPLYLVLKMCDDELQPDECEAARSFMNAFLAKQKSPELKDALDKIVGFVRGNEPLPVIECQQTKNRAGMLWYMSGYCLCSRFYKCRYQGQIEMVEGKEKALCTKFGIEQTQCYTGEGI